MPRRKKRQIALAPLGPGATVACVLRDSGHASQERSIDNQRLMLETYCRERGWTIVHWYADEAVQATDIASRAGFLEMVARCHDRPAPWQGVVFSALDRAARSVIDFQFHVADIRRQGIAVVFAGDNVPEGDLAPVIETLLAWKAEREIDTLARRVREGQHANIAAGLAHGGYPPVGYKSERVLVSNHRDGRPRYASRWVIDDDKAPLVRKAFEMRATGHTIADIMQATRLHAGQHSYARMFANPAYIGVYRYGSEQYPDAFPAIVSRELWDAVQALPAFPPRVHRSQYLLSGLVRCGVCGSNMGGHTRYAQSAAEHPKQRHYRYYVCLAKLRDDWYVCASKEIRADHLESAVLQKLGETILSPEHVWALVKATQERLSQPDVATDVARIERDIARCQRAIADLYDLAGSPGWEGAKRKMRELDAEVHRLEGERAAHVGSNTVRDVTPADVERYIAHWRDELSSDDFATRQRQLRLLLSSVTVTGGDITVMFRESLLF